ncbi:MAG: serine/threonine protein kinase [Gemmatimonadaceae bacterium]|nr:serine/threonine protein kinase [Gemmatimonadaceae bacterium]
MAAPRISSPLAPGKFTFKEVRIIGAGGLGQVVKIVITASQAPAINVGSEWAIKKLNAKWKSHPEARARFDREIAALQSMDHPNIIRCWGENVPGGERFYMMKLYGTSVRRHIAQAGRPTWQQVAGWGVVLAGALQYAHDKGYVHRDIKPDNILFDTAGPLMIADWGIGYFVHQASVVLQQLTRGGMGTEYYCSQEQWATGKCDCRGDVYALGMTLNEWVTGRQLPLASVGAGISIDTVANTSAGAIAFNQLIRSMTQRRRESRVGTMTGVAAELQRVLRLG